MPPKRKPSSSTATVALPCWCHGPSNAAEVQCSNCQSWIHYVCLGLSISRLSDLINDDPGLYLCKSCLELPDLNEIERLLKIDFGDCEIFRFNPSTYEGITVVPSLLSSLTTKLDDISVQLEKAQVVQRTQPTYSDMASRHIRAPGAQLSAPNQFAPAKSCDPTKSILISKVVNPRQFASSLVLKQYIRKLKPEMLEKISQGRLLASGNIILEANSSDHIADLLEGWPAEAFGGKATFRRTNFPNMLDVDHTIHGPGAPVDAIPNARQMVLKNLSKEYSLAEINAEVTMEYASANNFIEISTGADRNSRHIKFSLNNDDFNRISTHGAHIGLCLHRVEPWRPKPLQCFNCQRFGHSSSVCRSTSRCINCAESHTKTPGERCTKPTVCCNCKSDHMANSSKCAHYKQRLANKHVQ